MLTRPTGLSVATDAGTKRARRILQRPAVTAAAPRRTSSLRAAAATAAGLAAAAAARSLRGRGGFGGMATAAATAAAASPAAAAADQEVQLHVVAGSAAVLEDFKQRFEPADGFRCSVNFGAPPATEGGFDAASYSAALSTRQLGQLLLLTPSIASTQEFMRRHGSVLPEGAVLVADRQTSGKGRGGNVWTSPDGCLMFTASRRLKVPGSQAPFINYLICLAVVRGVADACAPWLGPAARPGIRIKWPNDIYAGGLKVGGALIHTTWAVDRFNVLAGIGLNISNRQPTTCLEEVVASQLSGTAAAGAADAAPVSIPRGAVLAHVLNHLEACYDEFESHGFARLEAEYLDHWLHSGQVVEVEEGAATAGAAPAAAASSGNGGRVRLTVAGLSESGFLLARDEAGGRWELTPDGNSLDMMVGLIRRKLPG